MQRSASLTEVKQKCSEVKAMSGAAQRNRSCAAHRPAAKHGKQLKF
jgi:hypothetical protein